MFGPVEDDVPLCTYLVVDSRDQLLVNLSPPAIDVIMEVTEVSINLMTVGGLLCDPSDERLFIEKPSKVCAKGDEIQSRSGLWLNSLI